MAHVVQGHAEKNDECTMATTINVHCNTDSTHVALATLTAHVSPHLRLRWCVLRPGAAANDCSRSHEDQICHRQHSVGCFLTFDKVARYYPCTAAEHAHKS